MIKIGTIEFEGLRFADWVTLREAVLRKPLGLTYSEGDILAETDQIHLGAFDGQELIGGLILVPSGLTFKMRQVAILPSWQGKGVGRELVKHAELFVLKQGGTEIILHAREMVMPFYARLGYEVEGDRFTEVGLPHFRMRKVIV